MCKLCSSFFPVLPTKGPFRTSTPSVNLCETCLRPELRVALSSRDFITTLLSSQSFKRRIFTLIWICVKASFHVPITSAPTLHPSPAKWDVSTFESTWGTSWVEKLVFRTKSFWKESPKKYSLLPPWFTPRLWISSNLGRKPPVPTTSGSFTCRDFHSNSCVTSSTSGGTCGTRMRDPGESATRCHPTLLKGSAWVCDRFGGQCSASGMPCFVRKVQKDNRTAVPTHPSKACKTRLYHLIRVCFVSLFMGSLDLIFGDPTLTHTVFQDAFHAHDVGHLCLRLRDPRSTSFAGSHNTSCFPENTVSHLLITGLVDGRGILTRNSQVGGHLKSLRSNIYIYIFETWSWSQCHGVTYFLGICE